MTTDTPQIKGVPIEPVSNKISRFTGLFWGPAGVGKTTLACTAPGKKLILNFDPDGPNSVASRDDVFVADFSKSTYSITDSFKNEADPLGLKAHIENYDTIIVDSITNATDKALDAGIGSSLIKGSYIEKPALASYQLRNRLSLKLVKNILAFTGKHYKHCIFIGHEAGPHLDNEGTVLFITMSIGGDLANSLPIDFGEVWCVYEVPGKGRHIAIRPCRSRKPMKTRMFTTTGEPEFAWKFNADTNQGDHTIEKWYELWELNGKRKLPIPK